MLRAATTVFEDRVSGLSVVQAPFHTVPLVINIVMQWRGDPARVLRNPTELTKAPSRHLFANTYKGSLYRAYTEG